MKNIYIGNESRRKYFEKFITGIIDLETFYYH